DAVLATGSRERVGDRSHSTRDKAPGALVAVQVAEEVVELDIGGAWRERSGVDADHSPRAEWGLDLLRLEKSVEDVGDARHRQRAPVVQALRTGEGLLDVVPSRRRS